jgi:hypothetical protein
MKTLLNETEIGKLWKNTYVSKFDLKNDEENKKYLSFLKV